MQSKLNPYIGFMGNAREAMEFYKSVFGGELTLNTIKDGGMPHDPAQADNVMHGMLVAGNGITLMGSDMVDSKNGDSNISISLSGDNEAELSAYFNKISAGGNVQEPLAKAPWGDTFGMLTDKYGIHWMFNIAGEKA